MGRGFVFRLPLPGHRFVSDEVFDTEEEAAFAADVFKLHVLSSYCLKDKSLSPTLPQARFDELLALAGGNTSDLKDLLTFSCKEYLANGGHELLTVLKENAQR